MNRKYQKLKRVLKLYKCASCNGSGTVFVGAEFVCLNCDGTGFKFAIWENVYKIPNELLDRLFNIYYNNGH